MFGGAGLFRDGLMFALIADDVLFFKVDAESAADFEAENLAAFTYITKKGDKGVMSYRRAPERCLDDPDQMVEWAIKGFYAALRADAKKSKNKLRKET